MPGHALRLRQRPRDDVELTTEPTRTRSLKRTLTHFGGIRDRSPMLTSAELLIPRASSEVRGLKTDRCGITSPKPAATYAVSFAPSTSRAALT